MSVPTQPSSAVLSAILEAGNGILQTKFTYFAAYTVAVYDHLLTLDLEIKYIWMRRFNAVTVAFILTRYYFLFAASMFLFVFIEPLISPAVCDRVILFLPLGVGTPLSVLPNFIIVIRIYAMYGRNKMLAFVLCVYILVELSLSLWSDLTPSVSPIDVFASLGYPELSKLPSMRFCVAQLSNKLTGVETSLGQIMQSIFDTVALLLILVCARRQSSRGLVALIAKQGLIYYILNMATYLAWTFMLIFAPASVKQIMGGPALLFACVAVNRFTLHLKSYSPEVDSESDGKSETLSIAFAHDRSSGPRARRRNSWLGASTLEMTFIPRAREDQQTALEMHDLSSDREIYLDRDSEHSNNIFI
ncbi:hypothetical protein SCHPADRAFT_676768 [Schizopora paradoxa]|uniref:DUF6533 domain-containing protein n=1 Tax=Schizopora paradoxa TaxID=27342 RepID=A0A0H2R4X3_9AGAM|nr:hypothetical protein SCHPADRAFT_676768 [Schizopora paradoxa]